jgi:hypothetical protein
VKNKNMSLNDKNFITEIAEDVKENPETSLRLIKRFLPLAIMLLLAGLLGLYFVKTDHTAQPITNSGAEATIQSIADTPK